MGPTLEEVASNLDEPPPWQKTLAICQKIMYTRSFAMVSGRGAKLFGGCRLYTRVLVVTSGWILAADPRTCLKRP